MKNWGGGYEIIGWVGGMERWRWVEFFCEGEDDIGHDDDGRDNEPEDGGDDDGRDDDGRDDYYTTIN
jgi:hypothetical protein